MEVVSFTLWLPYSKRLILHYPLNRQGLKQGSYIYFFYLKGLMEMAPNPSVVQPAVQCKWLSLFSFVDCPLPYLIANTRPTFVMAVPVHAGDSCPSANPVKVTGRLWDERQLHPEIIDKLSALDQHLSVICSSLQL